MLSLKTISMHYSITENHFYFKVENVFWSDLFHRKYSTKVCYYCLWVIISFYGENCIKVGNK